MSDRLQLFAKEQERNKRLCSSAPQTSDAAPLTPSTSASTTKSAAKKKQNLNSRKKSKNGKEVGPVVSVKNAIEVDEALNETGGNRDEAQGTKTLTLEKEGTTQGQPENPNVHPAECRFCMHMLLYRRSFSARCHFLLAVC